MIMAFKKKLTVCYFRQKKAKKDKIVVLTAYDAATAKLAEDCGVELILVGDSLGMTVLGYPSTIPVTIEESLCLCSAVVRGTTNSFVVGDMPFMSYQISPEEAMRNAARYLKEARVDGVKVEGGRKIAPTVARLVNAGVPVMGHIGLLPQSVLTSGGYRIAGRSDAEADRLVEDAKSLEDAGAFCMVLEGIPAEVSKRITESVNIPTIGIGAGVHCDGQVQVVSDMLGLFPDFLPKHAKCYVNLSDEMRKAFSQYVEEVKDQKFPDAEHSF
jgi:3-methyl-2-oxobutanoate hydroxymethyltransferase